LASIWRPELTIYQVNADFSRRINAFKLYVQDQSSGRRRPFSLGDCRLGRNLGGDDQPSLP